MKKLCVVLVLLLLFCGCQSVADNSTTPPTTTTTGAGDTTLSTNVLDEATIAWLPMQRHHFDESQGQKIKQYLLEKNEWLGSESDLPYYYSAEWDLTGDETNEYIVALCGYGWGGNAGGCIYVFTDADGGQLMGTRVANVRLGYHGWGETQKKTVGLIHSAGIDGLCFDLKDRIDIWGWDNVAQQWKPMAESSDDLQEIQRKNQVLQSVRSLHARYADVTKFRYEVDGVHTDENSKTTYDRVRIYTVSTKPIQDADGYEYYQIFTHRWCYVERESTAVFVENANAQLVSFEEVLLQALKDRKGGTPLVFVDSTNFRDQAYLLGAVDGGVFYPADCYAYNDRPLSDYQETEATVTGSILPLGSTLTFRDTNGGRFTSSAGVLTAKGAGRVIDGTVEVRTKLDTAVDGWWIGSTDPSLFPAVRTKENTFCADMNGDGDEDTVSVSFTDSTVMPPFSCWQLAVEIGEKTYTVSDPSAAVRPEDFQIFLLDLEADGQMELLIYERYSAKFSGVSLWQLTENEYTCLYTFAIDPMP